MVIHYKLENEKFQNKLEKVQYEACFAIIGAIQGTSRQTFYDKLDLHSLNKRRWHSKLTFLKNIKWIFAKISQFVHNISLARELPFEISIN